MKKLLVPGVSMLLALSGCGGSSAPSSNNGNNGANNGTNGAPNLDAGSVDDGGGLDDTPAEGVDFGRDAAACEGCTDTGPDLSSQTDADDEDVGPMTIGEMCFPERNDGDGPDYDQFSPRTGSHCMGTNHQHIWGVEEVVFLGDSVTVGTPPTISTDFYRTQLANALAQKFSLRAPGYLWRVYNPDTGTSAERISGDFRNCSKWGARTDDLLEGGNQIEKCFPDGGLDERTLVIMTIGGNDIANITQEGGAGGASLAEVTQTAVDAVDYLEDAVEWLTDPQRFPDGSYVLFANPFEFTDGTGDTSSCPAADISGLEEWDNPDDLADLIIWINEQWMRIAVATATDMIFMLENFCGHGFVATGPDADTSARCYLGPNTARWFDDTCIHPNPTGHDVISQMFMSVVDEPGSAP